MTQKFSAKLRTGNDYTFVKLRGFIDDDDKLASLRRKLQGKVVVLDLADVERINSCGVRDWVNWLGEVEGTQHTVVMIRCSPAIVTQANMVTNFCGHALISSFYAPYYCPNCDISADKLLTVEQFNGMDEASAPTFLCEECGQELEFDDFEETYFAFLANVDQDRIDARIRSLLEEVAPDLERKIQALNEGNLNTLSGPSLHTATLTTPTSDPTASGGFGSLMSKPTDIDRVKLPEPTAHAADTRASTAATPGPEAAPKGRSNLITYGLIAIAAIVVAILLVLVLTLD